MNFAPYFDKAQQMPGTPTEVRGYVNASSAAYHAVPALSASLLKQPSAAHMLHKITEPDTIGPEAAAVGTLAHWAVLEPEKILNIMAHCVECETKTLDSKAAERQRKENPDKLVCTGEHLILAAELRRAVAMHDKAAELLTKPGCNEISGFLFDGGVWRKWRPDRVLKDSSRILDVKTTRFPLVGRSGLALWQSECWSRGYYLQAAWYLHHHELATGRRPNHFTFVAVSKEAPFHCRLFTLANREPGHPNYDGSALQRARQLLGLESGNDVDRVTVFRDCAQQTIAAAARGQILSPELLRALWPAEENETDEPEIGLPFERK